MAFRHSQGFDPLPRRDISWSIRHQQQYQLDDQLIDRLDHTESLGGEDNSGDQIGHTGCVNALSWSPSGQLLASGSDDRNVVLWKLGSDHLHPTADPDTSYRQTSSRSVRYPIGASRRSARDDQSQPGPNSDSSSHLIPPTLHCEVNGDDTDIVQPWPQRSFPALGLGMLGKIETGHRANIFSVKWAPNASERRLFTCAGDSHVRVFDINYMPSSVGTGADGTVKRYADGRESTIWPEHSGACIRLFRCHRGRAKRISTEVSPDVFLTCGEDGDVRQMDLRAPHTCRSRTEGSCPPPLAHYASVLYSLSVSKTEPWLFAVAGESPLAYLHDRRMIPRLIKRDWGMVSNADAESNALTMCVRSFGVPPGGFEAPWAQDDGRTALVSEAPQLAGRRLLMGNRDSITACKLSEHNGRDLLVSYSSGHIYRFDIYDQPGVLQANLERVRFSLDRDDRHQSPQSDAPADEQLQQAKKKESRKAVGQRQDVDVEKAQNRFSQDTDVPPHDGGTASTTDGHDESDDVATGSGEDVQDESSSNEADEVDSHDDQAGDNDEHDEEAGHDEEEESEDSDNGEDFMSDDDLVQLLQEEDDRYRSASSAAPAVPIVYPRSAYKGHCNRETVKDVAFAGRSDDYVISGSDDGNWFMWDKLTSEIKGIWHGDSSVVNVMAMHPDLPVFAISGIDDTIKIFSPVTITPFPPPPESEATGPHVSTGENARTKRARLASSNERRSYKTADRLANKDEICARNDRSLDRNFISPAANILWRLHPRLMGFNTDDDDPERQIEGECTIM